MQIVTSADLHPEQRRAPHRARAFAELPDAWRAVNLLAELADASCAFAPVSMDRPLALYGAGDLGRLAREFLTEVGHDFTMAVDRNADALAGSPHWSGIELQRPDMVPSAVKHEVRLAVSIVKVPYVPVERALRASGFDDVLPFYDLAESFRAVHPLSNGWFAPALSARDRDNTAMVLSRWHDDTSRAHHLQFLAWRRLREEWSFVPAPVTTEDRFFIPELLTVLRDDEILLDAGAHHGNVSDAFVRQTQGAFRQIVAIEPDLDNCTVLQERLLTLLPDDPRVTVYDCVLAAEEREASFHAGLGYASQLSPTGNMLVTTRPLDALGISPSFVKLHLEGAELPVLQGARQSLLASRPLIAATVYHNADGIWATPLWLMQMLPDYRFLFRVHSWCGTGAVVYAIPAERVE